MSYPVCYAVDETESVMQSYISAEQMENIIVVVELDANASHEERDEQHDTPLRKPIELIDQETKSTIIVVIIDE